MFDYTEENFKLHLNTIQYLSIAITMTTFSSNLSASTCNEDSSHLIGQNAHVEYVQV